MIAVRTGLHFLLTELGIAPAAESSLKLSGLCHQLLLRDNLADVHQLRRRLGPRRRQLLLREGDQLAPKLKMSWQANQWRFVVNNHRDAIIASTGGVKTFLPGSLGAI